MKNKVLLNKINTMTQRTNQSPTLAQPVLLGAGIGLLLIGTFLITAGEPNPEWGKYWRIKPLIIVPLAGGMAGLFYYLTGYLQVSGWKKVLLNLFCIIVYIVALWLGSVLGLNGTYWN